MLATATAMVIPQPAAAAEVTTAAISTAAAAPTIATVATDKADGDKQVAAGGVIKDVVTYSGLTPGVKYVLHTQLFNKTDGSLVNYTLATPFTAVAANGTLTVEIPMPVGLESKTLVVYETIWQAKDVLVGKHRDKIDIRPGAVPVVKETNPDNADQTINGQPPVGANQCAISGNVWKDTNNNGTRDAGEELVPNITVAVRYAPNGATPGTWLQETKTDANGHYSLTVSNVSQCAALFADFDETTIPAGWTPFSGGDSDLVGWNPGSGWTNVVNVPAGTETKNVDMGLRSNSCAISGNVWKDANADGIRNAGEELVPNVTVALRYAPNGATPGTWLQETKTDANGHYSFTVTNGSNCSSLFVDFDENGVAGWVPFSGGDSDLVNWNPGTGWTNVVNIPVGTEVKDVDMGLRTNSCAISGNVWKDANNDGIRNAGEELVPNITVSVRYAPNGARPGTMLQETKTDANGHYSFTVTNGSTCSALFVDFDERTIPSGWNQFSGGDSDLDSGNLGNGWTNVVNVPVGTELKNVDMGLRDLTKSTCVIEGTIWRDNDWNGAINIGNGDDAVAGTKVTVYWAPYFRQEASIATGWTDGNGNYSIRLDGKYCGSQVFIQADGGGWSAFSGGSSDVNPTYQGWPFTNPVDVPLGTTTKGLDIGFRYTGEVSGTFGCTGADWINGGTVELINTANGSVVKRTTVQNQAFKFTGVGSGRYWVKYRKDVGRPPGWFYRIANSGDWWSYLQFENHTAVVYAGTREFNYSSGSKQTFWGCTDRDYSPIMLDLNGNGQIDTSSVDEQPAGAKFDLLGTGQPVASGWSADGDGFLVAPSADGSVTSIDNLFGGALGEGYAKLAKLDANKDGELSGAELDTLKVWVDADGDHVAKASEIKELSDFDIETLSVEYKNTPVVNNGNVVIEHSDVTLTDGSTMVMGDAYFTIGGKLTGKNRAALAKIAGKTAKAIAHLPKAERKAVRKAFKAAR